MSNHNQTRQQSQRSGKSQNSPSRLLSNEENEVIFNALGNRSVTLSTAVVQVFLADQNTNSGPRWNKRCTGVLTFVKDNENRSYYLRVFNLKQRRVEWQQEVYSQFKYKEPRDQFHTFEADTCSAGINFADPEEAKHFASVVNDTVNKRVERRRTKRRQTQMARQAGGGPPSNTGAPLSISGPQSSLPATPEKTEAPAPTYIAKSAAKKDKKSRNDKRKITKDEISGPSDFRHVNHVGWDPNSGFDVNNLDSDMKSLFEMAGISQDALQDETIRKQIYDVIESQGGLDAVKQQVGKRPAAPSPAPPPPPPVANRGGAAGRELPPPPPPSRHGGGGAPPPAPSF
ncbi:WASL [Bugula neritina]|uniref:WASL n=1 Tax=Bugula neritina TaxID=10212 RepID=A0A7J7IZ88_BUGNE|nr:WASL [Bugula neritina]